MKRIAGVISLIGAVGWLLFFVYLVISEKILESKDGLFPFLSGTTTLISTIYYVVVTRFGKKTELEKITEQNKVIEKQIEQQELKQQLEKINKL